MDTRRNPLVSPQLGDAYSLADGRRIQIKEFQTDSMDNVVTIIYWLHTKASTLDDGHAVEEVKQAEQQFVAMLAQEKASVLSG